MFRRQRRERPQKVLEGVCSYYEECESSDFEAMWGDVDTCVSDNLDDYDVDAAYEDCEFDKSKAKSCLKTIKEATKECDFYELLSNDDCEEAYDCGGTTDDTGRR